MSAMRNMKTKFSHILLWAARKVGYAEEKMFITLMIMLALLLGAFGISSEALAGSAPVLLKKTVSQSKDTDLQVEEDEEYTSKEEVALYLHLFGHLPDNYITKKEAKKLGWVSSEGNLDEVAPGKSIGGDYFGNYEGLLPEKKGREYHECDIDFTGGRRNGKRIIYSNDGSIYYTEDHYQTFEQLY